MKKNNLPEHFRILQVDKSISDKFLADLIKRHPKREKEFRLNVKNY